MHEKETKQLLYHRRRKCYNVMKAQEDVFSFEKSQKADGFGARGLYRDDLIVRPLSNREESTRAGARSSAGISPTTTSWRAGSRSRPGNKSAISGARASKGAVVPRGPQS